MYAILHAIRHQAGMLTVESICPIIDYYNKHLVG